MRKMSEAKKKLNLYPIHLVVGFGIIALFWLMPPIGSITPLGMRCVGAFLGMVYLWSACDTLWPSLVGLFMLGISGYGGEGGFNGLWMNAVGNYTVLLTLFAMVLFGAMEAAFARAFFAAFLPEPPIMLCPSMPPTAPSIVPARNQRYPLFRMPSPPAQNEL